MKNIHTQTITIIPQKGRKTTLKGYSCAGKTPWEIASILGLNPTCHTIRVDGSQEGLWEAISSKARNIIIEEIAEVVVEKKDI